jgi:hypothetical protein
VTIEASPSKYVWSERENGLATSEVAEVPTNARERDRLDAELAELLGRGREAPGR